MTKKKAAGLVLLGVIILASYLFNQDILIPWLDARNPSPKITALSLSGINETKQENIWVCPMHSEIMQSHPGTCPICGMDLVESGKHAAHDHGIQVDSASIQKLGVRLANVRKIHLDEEVQTYGNVTVDESTLYNVHTKFEGWIKKLYIHSIGQVIRKGQVIYEIYSPDLITRQKEYLRFVARRNQILQTIGDISLQENEYAMNLLQELSSERTKFLHTDISIETLRKLEDDKKAIEVVQILAGQSGVVTQIGAREGSFVTPAAPLFTVANISTAWINIMLYPDQISHVKNGDEATITTPDGRTIKTRIEFLNPLAENNKVSARVAIDNTRLHLRPGSFVDVKIHGHPHEALALPRSAVIKTGQGDMVILSRGDGHFLPVRIETGIESEDWVEIVDGLHEDAEVAVNGQFLLDSAASMSAAVERMRSGKRDAE